MQFHQEKTMDFKFRHTDKIVGAFIFFALVIVITGLIMIAVSKNLFVKTHSFKTLLSDAEGLSTSTTLKFKGYEIGKVKSFLLNDDNNIDVELVIYKQFRDKIVSGSAIYRQVNPITGSMSLILLYPNRLPVNLSQDDVGGIALLEEGEYIPSLDMRDGQRLLEANMIERSGDAISILFEDARDFVSNLRQEFQLKKDSFKTFFQNVVDFSETLARNREIIDNLNQLLDPRGGPLFDTLERFSQISVQLRESANRLNELIENYKDPEGLITKMLQVNQGELDQTLQNINQNLTTLHHILTELKEQSPLIADILNRSNKTLQAINNNPFLRGGIPKESKKTNSSKKKRLDIDEEK